MSFALLAFYLFLGEPSSQINHTLRLVLPYGCLALARLGSSQVFLI